MDNEFLYQAGTVIFEGATLVSVGGNKLDIAAIAIEIDLFEDMFHPAMHGVATITENFNLVLNLPLIGEEILILKFKTPTGSTIEKAFKVHQVSQKEFQNVKKHIYVIHFTSIESTADISSKVCGVYEGTPSECAKKIFDKYFKGSKITVSPSSNIIKYVAPTVSPFTALTMLASKAINKDLSSMPDYLFYENNQGYMFTSLSDLYKVEPKYKFRFSNSRKRVEVNDGESVRDISAEFENVKKFTFSEVSNSLGRKMSGSYGKKVWEVDMLRKSFRKHTYDANKDFDKSSHLNKIKPFSKYENTSPSTVVDYEFVHAYMHDNIKVDRDAELSCKRSVAIHQSNWIKCEIVVSGNTNIKVGDTITFEMPLGEVSDERDKYKTNNLDPFYSGKYIITAIRHQLTLSKHDMVMEICKDSFNEEIDFNRAGK